MDTSKNKHQSYVSSSELGAGPEDVLASNFLVSSPDDSSVFTVDSVSNDSFVDPSQFRMSLANAVSEITESLIEKFLKHGYVVTHPVADKPYEECATSQLKTDISAILSDHVLNSARYRLMSELVSKSFNKQLSNEDIRIHSHIEIEAPVFWSVVSIKWTSPVGAFKTDSADFSQATPPSRDDRLGGRLVSGRARSDATPFSDNKNSIQVSLDDALDRLLFEHTEEDPDLDHGLPCFCG